ncbi:MAG: hypothetical protein H0A76_12845 [Candidatus Thiodubiliella endoseptemdiera]|uniref:DNA-directed DNA polymerase family A palm domain-containing protein n=1 Tax=Candidatus Thiodubiliella endoseptemdiera TaxID=2738886 RepID=A0A853FAL1_9GAMM|nr:hypothetical protein [Candidatus Thiodubiliella endoseptemdiera]
MLDGNAWIGKNNPDIEMIMMQVHDELVFGSQLKTDEFAHKNTGSDGKQLTH